MGFKSCPGAKTAADEYFKNKPESIVSLPTGQGLVIKKMSDSIKAGENYGDIHMKPQKLKWTPELVREILGWDSPIPGCWILDFPDKWEKSLILTIEHELPGDGRILDFGAGDGDLIKLLL